MSKRKTQTCCLVVDASIAHAAGTSESQHPTAKYCRDFLLAIRRVCHRMAWNDAIAGEWNEHQSSFAMTWLASMMSIKKLRPVADQSLDDLHTAIDENSGDDKVAAVMHKDAHLIAAALSTDSRVASLDDNARRHFARLGAIVESVGNINWVNPVVEREPVIAWLEKGAPEQKKRRLRTKT